MAMGNTRNTRAYYRRVRSKNIERKKKLYNIVYHCNYEKPEGKLSKGKVHCSCPWCAFSGLTYRRIKRGTAMDYSEKHYEEYFDDVV